jgi:hypothetical protein
MKRLKKILVILLVINSILICQISFALDNALEKSTLRSAWHIDTNLKQTFYKEDGIHIEGWKLATEPNSKIVVSIDEREISQEHIKYSYKYDLISIVKGYGTYEENPIPNFDIDIDLVKENITEGKHKLKIELKNSDETLTLQSQEEEINISRNIKYALQIDTKLEGATFGKSGIIINGWKLATEANTKLVAKIDEEVIEDTKIDMYYAYDLISIIGGYGTYKENPTPNYTINIPTKKLAEGKHVIKVQLVTFDDIVLKEEQNNIIIDTAIRHAMHIDTNVDGMCWKPNGIEIKGWKLATEPKTNINIYIENRKIEDFEINTYYAYDLISIVKGYGTYKENPTPNFTINIPVTEFEDTDNILKIQMVTEEGKVLEERTYNIINSKTRMHVETPYDRTKITNSEHDVSGWVMTTEENARIRILIDGRYLQEDGQRTDRKDVLNAIKGYGDEKTNALPGFEFSIDFSKYDLGLHQIAVRVENQNGKIVGEEVIYVWLRSTIIYDEGTYGDSGLTKAGNPYGSKLQYYRYGNGENVFFATFTVHGFEDNWNNDGEALVNIANKFYDDLKKNHNDNFELADKWTIYILPEINPDGRKLGTGSNGPGRTTLYSQAPNNKGIDLNRCWKNSGFRANESSRNYAGTAPYQAYEAQALRDFLISHKSQNGQTVLVDLHGWLEQLIGDREIGMYYAVQFPNAHGRSLDRYGDGYIINWARTALASNGRIARTSLIELPRNVYSNKDVENQKLAERYIQATLSMLHGVN